MSKNDIKMDTKFSLRQFSSRPFSSYQTKSLNSVLEVGSKTRVTDKNFGSWSVSLEILRHSRRQLESGETLFYILCLSNHSFWYLPFNVFITVVTRSFSM